MTPTKPKLTETNRSIAELRRLSDTHLRHAEELERIAREIFGERVGR